jgi:hypothetical protein
MVKLDAHDRATLVVFAYETGLVRPRTDAATGGLGRVGRAGSAHRPAGHQPLAAALATLVPAADSASQVPPKAFRPSPLVWPFLVSLTNV